MSDQEKLDYYITSLNKHINKWEDFIDLYNKVKKIKDIDKFKDFCVRKYNEWETHLSILYLYLEKNEHSSSTNSK
jgi:hypothetical protein